MSLGKGHQTYVLIGPEASYGVAPSSNIYKLEVDDVSCDPVIGNIPDPSLFNARSRRALYQAGILYRGTIRIRANYEGVPPIMLFKAALGGYAFAQATAGPPQANNHTITESTTLRSLSMWMQEGGVAGTTQLVLGLVITGFNIRGTAGQGPDAMLTYEFNYVATDKQIGITEPSSTTFATPNPALYHQAITMVDGSGDSTPIINSFDFGVQIPLDEGRYKLGSINPLQPVPNDFIVPTLRIVREFDSTAMFNKARSFADPAAALNLVFQGGLIVAGHNFELSIKMSSAKLLEYGNPISDYGIIKANAAWTGFYNNTDASCCVLRIKNSETTLAALP